MHVVGGQLAVGVADWGAPGLFVVEHGRDVERDTLLKPLPLSFKCVRLEMLGALNDPLEVDEHVNANGFGAAGADVHAREHVLDELGDLSVQREAMLVQDYAQATDHFFVDFRLQIQLRAGTLNPARLKAAPAAGHHPALLLHLDFLGVDELGQLVPLIIRLVELVEQGPDLLEVV